MIKGKNFKAKYWIGCLLIMLGTGLTGTKAYAAKGDVAIDSTNFEDPFFRIYIRNFDLNKDDILSLAERKEVKEIHCNENNITSFDGIEQFPNLEKFYCDNIPITELDFSGNPKLAEVSLWWVNNCTKINLSKNAELTYLNLHMTGLENVDLSGCTKLRTLYMDGCPIKKLDLSYNTELAHLECLEDRELETLNLTKCTQLRTVSLRETRVKSLDLSKSTQLGTLSCERIALLETLKVDSDELEKLECVGSPRLKTLDLSGCKLLRAYYNIGDEQILNRWYGQTRRFTISKSKSADLNEYTRECMEIDSGLQIMNNVKVTVTPSDKKGGTVTGSGTYNSGKIVTLTASEAAGGQYRFMGFREKGIVLTTENRYAIKVYEDRDIEAVFTYWFVGNVGMEMSNGFAVGSKFSVRLEDTDPTATYSFQWYRGNDKITGATSKTYVATNTDIGSVLSCVVTSSRGGSKKVDFGRAVQKKIGPGVPNGLGTQTTSYKGGKDGKITGTTTKMEYSTKSSFEGSKTCGENTTSGLAAGTYYVRIKATSSTKAGEKVKVVIEEGPEILKGTVKIKGEAKFDEQLSVSVENSNNTGDFTYSWKRNGKEVKTGSSSYYWLQKEDIGCTISCTVTSSVEAKSISGTLNTKVQKADAPAAPKGLSAKTPSRTGLSDGQILGVAKTMEYSTSADFASKKKCTSTKLTLKAGTYYVRYAETDTTKAGKATKIVVPKGLTATETFTDVKKGDWFEEAVKYVYAKKIMNGVSENRFDPQGVMTRAQFVTALYNFAGCPGVTKKAGFKDVVKGSWYEQAVNWAYEVKITSGVSKKEFGTNEKITRQQAAVMLYNYAKVKKLKTDGKETVLDKFSDKKQVANWAKESLAWAVQNGVISGKLKGNKTILAPNSEITRAECAQMIKNMVDKLK